MKTYLLLVMSAAALASGPGIVSAQTDDGRSADREYGSGKGRHGRHGFRDPARMVERMTRHLDLDETQQQTISNIVEAARPEFESLRERGMANRTAMRELDPADADYSAKLNNLAIENGELVAEGTMLFGRVRSEIAAELTDEQRAELEDLMSERRERFRHRHRGPDID